MTDNFQPGEFTEEDRKDKEAIEFFMSAKSTYVVQRLPYEEKWKQALAAFHLTDDFEKVYEGRSRMKNPVMKTKVRGIASRISKIIFNVFPIGRLEDKRIDEVQDTIVDLWNKYIFEHQLDNIGFKTAFKEFIKNKVIEGTAVAKITQELEEKQFTFFDNTEPENIVVKDDTYFRNILLTEFFSDVNKPDINDSQACVHSTSQSMEHLLSNEMRIEVTEVEDEEGNIVEEEEVVGFYKNLHLLQLDGKNISDEQGVYIEFLGLNKGESGVFQKSLRESRKTGFIQVDECYGKFDLDGDGIPEEVVCTIANGRIVIRLEPTPFKHKKYVRPFIVGRYEPVAFSLYGDSNVIAGKGLLMELNASRGQATDARTRAVSHMWYEDTSKFVSWNGTWTPNGRIKGNGQNGLTPIINPNLSHVSREDSELISRDIDQLWNLSPVQEGTSDSRLIPKTVGGTQEIISQNDMPLNEIIDNTIEEEMKPFIEMLFERNVVFKDFKEDLLVVWDEKEIEKAGFDENMDMSKALFKFNVKILGNLELSNEVAHQQGWANFIAWAQTVPPVAKRLDWIGLSNKQLASFGIKDDSEGIWLPDEVMAEIDAEEKQAQQAQQQGQEQFRQQVRNEGKEDEMFKEEVRVEGKTVEMQNEAVIERTTGQKVQ